MQLRVGSTSTLFFIPVLGLLSVFLLTVPSGKSGLQILDARCMVYIKSQVLHEFSTGGIWSNCALYLQTF